MKDAKGLTTIADAVIDVERGKDDLGKAEKYKQAAMKKKFIFLAILIVLVTIILLGKKLKFSKSFYYSHLPLLSVILSEFGAFSSSGGGTTIVKVNLCFQRDAS